MNNIEADIILNARRYWELQEDYDVFSQVTPSCYIPDGEYEYKTYHIKIKGYRVEVKEGRKRGPDKYFHYLKPTFKILE